ncbi:TPA: HNH endonuclease [Enterobacter hormaechei]|nr:HNH endonuclease [Enterobacter hormaechei]
MGEERKNINHNTHIVLYDEVSGLCPKCFKPLMVQNGKRKIKLYEVAHIYPFSPREEEKDLLKDEQLLCDDVDSEDNLIALCRDCHKLFDNPRTIEGYREMYAIKKQLRQAAQIKNSQFNFKIEEEIKEIIDILSTLEPSEGSQLSYKALRVDDKILPDSGPAFKIKVKAQVAYFYTEIKKLFQQLDQRVPNTSEIIFNEVKTYYLILKRENLPQSEIYNHLINWIKTNTKETNSVAAEVLVCFFIQNCEVYS